MEFHHFSHVHPLIFSEVKNDEEEKISCGMCWQKIMRFAYSCRKCSFFLHKLCAELPVEMEHPMHPEHPLTLQSWPTGDCHFCGEDSCRFTYNCFFCNFYMDTKCAVRTQSVEHKSHEHPLSPMLSPALFQCNACGMEHKKGLSYICNTCRFWIHEDCASLPTTIKHYSHVHPLTLIYSVHSVYNRNAFSRIKFSCCVCEEEVNRDFWIYNCQGCRHFVHVNCSTKIRERKTKVDNLDEADVIHLKALHDESVNLMDHFVKKISLGNNRAEVELNHFSHTHSLTLFNAYNDNDLYSGSELSILNGQKNDKVCDACVRPISAPFYNCTLCNFFLHKWCAELPKKLQHPCHTHPLFLQLGQRPQSNEYFMCQGCGKACNGFTFRCVEPQCENYYLDVQCASLPCSIVHEVHEHPLLLRNNCVTEGCAACAQRDWMFSFGCDICNFTLHYKCALLPGKIKHRYDEHPFTLTHAPIKDGPNEYICEFCEEEIVTKCWFYHCVDCDKSACAKCIYEDEKEFPTIKLGSTCKMSCHQQPLTLIEATNRSPSMGYNCCTRKIFKNERVFKCMQCNIMRHLRCTYPALWY